MVANKLTKRELEVLDLIYFGLKNHEIARKLSISPRTVENHIEKIFKKLGAKNRTEAVINAIRFSILEL